MKEAPVEGAANTACVRAIARALGVGRDAVTIDPASKGRRKLVRVRVPEDGAAAALQALLERASERH